MIQTLNPYTSTAKTAEIMARYRPIAPRPQTPSSPNGGDGENSGSGSGSGSVSGSSPSSMSPTIQQSPYLRNVWPHLQSRPTRTRKRGRTSLGPPPPPTFKRPRTLLQGLSPPFHVTTSPAKNLSVHVFTPPPLVTLPLLPCSSPHSNMQNVIDLNKSAADQIPEERDLITQLQLQKPTTNVNVISPTPIRLVPSTVTIRTIKNDTVSPQTLKTPEQIEKELESQISPAFVSDSNNKVRLVNSAYKQMVGQPECPWLESMVTGDGSEVACKSICGDVALNFTDSDQTQTISSNGFSCWARIEWAVNGKKNSVNAFGEAMKLSCDSKDYKLAWRFHTKE